MSEIKFLYNQNQSFVMDRTQNLFDYKEIIDNISRFRTNAKPQIWLVIIWILLSIVFIGISLFALFIVVVNWINVTLTGFKIYETFVSIIGVLISLFGLWVGYSFANLIWNLISNTFVHNVYSIYNKTTQNGEIKLGRIVEIKEMGTNRLIQFTYMSGYKNQEKLDTYVTSSEVDLIIGDSITILSWYFVNIVL